MTVKSTHIIMLICGLMLTLLSTTAAQVDILSNGSFETDLSGWSETLPASQATTNPNCGTGHASLGSNGALWQDGVAFPGNTYTVNFDALLLDPVSGWGTVNLVFYDSAWNSLGNQSTSINSSTYAGGTITLVAPANTAIWGLWVGNGGGMYIDCMELLETSASSGGTGTFSCAGGLLTNPEFESDLTNWNSVNSTTITSDSYSGTKAATNSQSGTGGMLQTFTSSPGEVYSVSAYMKKSGSFDSKFIIKFKDAANTEIESFSKNCTSSSYELYHMTKVAPAGTASVDIMGWKEGGTGAAFWDGFCVETWTITDPTCTSNNSCELFQPYSEYPFTMDYSNTGNQWTDYGINDFELCDLGNGRLNIQGSLINGTDADWDSGVGAVCGIDDGWLVDIEIFDRQSWTEFQGNYEIDPTSPCATNYVNFDYWDVQGTLTGIGCNAGSVIDINGPAMGYRLQVGYGGNKSNCDFGMSTWFDTYIGGQSIKSDLYIQLDEACYNNLLPADENLYIEAECVERGTSWTAETDNDASNDKKAIVVSGNNSNTTPPTGAESIIRFDFDLNNANDYNIIGRVKTPTSNDNSFWVRVDGSSWVHWASIPSSSAWQWNQVHDSNNSDQPVIYNLDAGSHTIEIAYSEDGVGLDKIYISSTSELPSGEGGWPGTCEAEICYDGIDNDGNGEIDCDDNVCDSDIACKTGSCDFTIRALGNCGSEQIQLRLDGVTVATYTLTSSFQEYNYSGYDGEEVSIYFGDGNNNGCDLNARIDYIQINGELYQTETSATHSNTSCNSGEWMWCAGNVNFGSIDCGSTYSCDDGLTLDHYGASCDGSQITLDIPNLSNVIKTTLEVVYKSCNAGSTIDVNTSIGTLTLPKVGNSNNGAYIYRITVNNALTNISHSPECGSCVSNNGLQSVLAFVTRSVDTGHTYTTTFTEMNSYCDIETFTLDIPTDTHERDIEIVVPISEVTSDGRYLTVEATDNSGTSTGSVTITGPDYSLGDCCLNIITILLDDVPGASSSIDISIITDGANNPNGSSCGQSWVLSGTVYADINCFPDELCADNQDNDGDGDIDCDDMDCTPQFNSAIPTTPDNCPALDNGTITVYSSGENLEYSIDGGSSYQSSNVFDDLQAGFYTVRIRNGASLCYTESTVTIDFPLITCTPVCDDRNTTDVIALYNFNEGSGTTVLDESGYDYPINLTIEDPANTSWSAQGLAINASTKLVSATASTKIHDAIVASGEFSIEAWVMNDNLTQDGSARIVSYSENTVNRNFTLGQEATQYELRTRTSTTSNNGHPELFSYGVVANSLQHVVYTFDTSTGNEYIYLDGSLTATGTRAGNFSNWNDTYNLIIANEDTDNRPWLGTLRMVAVYDKALTSTEITQHYNAGSECLKEICGDYIDNDNDGDVDCLDSDCSNITISNQVVSACIDHPLRDVATVTFDISWTNAPENDDLLITLGDNQEIIDVSGGWGSPQTITFIVPADGTTNQTIEADWINDEELCTTKIVFDAPSACTTDELNCNILYIHGLDKPEDGEAWDRGWEVYLDEINGSNSMTSILAQNDATGMGTYDPSDPTTPINVTLTDYDLIVVSPTTENHIASDLVDALKDTERGLVNINFDIAVDLGLCASTGIRWTGDAHIDNTTDVAIYDFDNPDGNTDLLGHGAYYPAANASLWAWAGDMNAQTNGIMFTYEATDALAGVDPGHGARSYIGFHMNGFYANPTNGGAYPTSPEDWFVPEIDLSLIGKELMEAAILNAASGCQIEICDNGVDDDGDGAIDCQDGDCGLPTIVNVSFVAPTDCNSNGSINITATGDNLEYSIDGGDTYQASPTFTGLPEGVYNIVVRNSVTLCKLIDEAILNDTTCIDCDLLPGEITDPTIGCPSNDPGLINAVQSPTPLCNMIDNEEFDNGYTGWYLNENNAAAMATFSADNTNQLSGANSAFIDVSATTGTGWHLEIINNGYDLISAETYDISFMAKAVANRSLYIALQLREEPYTEFWSQTVNLTTTAQTYSFLDIDPGVNSDNVGMVFKFGAENVDFYLDDTYFGTNGCNNPGIIYQWEKRESDGSGGWTAWTDITGATSESYDPPAIYVTTQYRRKDQIAGCADWEYTNEIEVIYNPIEVDLGANQSACPDEEITITASATGGEGNIDYLWSGGEITSSINVTATTNVIYTVTVTDENGCTATDNIQVTIESVPTANVTGDEVLTCDNTTATMTATPSGQSYLWSTGEATNSITVSAAGTYYVTVTNAAGCEGIDSLMVIEDTSPPTVTLDDTSFCVGESQTLSPTNLCENYPDIVAQRPLMRNGWQNIYGEDRSALVGDGELCFTLDDTNLSSAQMLGLNADPNSSNAYNNIDYAIYLYVRPDVNNYLVQIRESGASQANPYSSPTSYAGSTFCIRRTGTTIEYLMDGTVIYTSLTPSNVDLFYDHSVLSSTSAVWTGGYSSIDNISLCGDLDLDFSWSTGETTSTIDVSTTGNYTVTVTDAKGCTSSAQATVSEDPLPDNGVTKGRDITCTSDRAYATATAYYPEVPSYLDNTEYLTGSASCGDQYIHTEGQSPYSIVAHNLANSVSAGNTYDFDFSYKKSGTGTVLARIYWYESGYVFISSTSLTIANATGWTAGTISGVAPAKAANVQLRFFVYDDATLDLDCWEFGPQGSAPTYTQSFETTSPYQWSGPNGVAGASRTIFMGTPGIYTVTITDPVTGCSNVGSVEILDDTEAPDASATNDGPITCDNIEVTLTANSNTTGATYEWSDGLGTDATVSVNAGGTYTVTVTDPSNGCTTTASTTVDQNTTPTSIYCERYRIRVNDVWSSWVNFSGNCEIELCEDNGLSDIQFDAGPDINTGWVWRDEDGNIRNEVDEIVVFPNLSLDDAGTYTGELTNANGCISNISFDVIINPNPVASATNDGPLTCALTEVTMTASPVGMTYLWSTGGTAQTETATAPGIYTVTITDSTSGCTAITSTEVLQNTAIPNVVASGEETICEGGEVTISAAADDGSGAGYVYSWNQGLSDGPSHTLTVNATTTYTVTVTDSNGCTDTHEVTITVAPNTEINITAQDATICQGESTSLTSTNTGGTGTISYQWQQSANSNIWSDISGATNANYTTPALTATTYYRLVATHDGEGCAAAISASAQVTVETGSAIVSVTSDVADVCVGGSATLMVNENAANGGEIDYSTWTEGTGSVGSFYRNGTNTENHRIIGTDPWGNSTVVWEARPDATHNADGGWNHAYIPVDHTKLYRSVIWVNRKVIGTDGRFYSGLHANGSVNGVKRVTNGTVLTNAYFWNSQKPPVALAEDEWVMVVSHIRPSNHTGTSNHTDSGRYAVDGSYLGNISTDYQWLPETTTARPRTYLYYSVDTDVRQQWVYPRFDIVDGTEPSIQELLNGFDINNGLGTGATYEWFTGGCGGTLVGTGTTLTVNPTTTTTYYVRATGNCNTTDCESITITVNDPPAAAATNDGPLTCADTEATLTATPSGLSYEWSTNETTENITVNATGTYTVTVTDGSGCTATARTTVTEDITPPVADAGSDQEICASDDIALTATGGGTYLWSNGAGSTASVTVAPTSTTTYTVTVTAANGCTDTDQVIVEVNEGPTDPGAISGNEVECGSYDPSIITSTSLATGHVGLPISYNWQLRELDCVTGLWGDWSDITGAHDEDYDCPVIVTTTQYRRLAGQDGCSSWQISNVITKEVIDNQTDPGTIAANQAGCDSFDPDQITGTLASGGCGGTMEYQWQMRTEGGSWTDIPGATGVNYNPSTISETTEYRRLVRSAPCPFVESNVVTMTINSAEIVNAALGSNIDCEGNCTGTIEVEVDYTITGPFTIEYTFEGTTYTVGPFSFGSKPPEPIIIEDLCAGVYSDITVISTTTGCSVQWPDNITISESHADWEHVTHAEDVSDCNGVCDGAFVVDANLGVTGDFMIEYTFEGNVVSLGPYSHAGDIIIGDLCEGVYSDITIISVESGCSDIWPDDIEITTPDFEANISATVDDDCQINEGSVTINVSDGVYPYTIEWKSEDGTHTGTTTINHHGDETIYGLHGGTTYCFKITDSLGCVEN